MHLRKLDGFRYTFGFIVWSLVCSSIHGAPICVTSGTMPVAPTTTVSIPHSTKGHSTCQTKHPIDNTSLIQTSDDRSESSEFKTGTTVNLTQTPVHTSTVTENNHSDSSTVLFITSHPVSLPGKAKEVGHFARSTLGCAEEHKKTTGALDLNTKVSGKSAAGIATQKEERVSFKARETGTEIKADSVQPVDETSSKNWQPTHKLFINDLFIRSKRQRRSVESEGEDLDQAHDLSFSFFDEPQTTNALTAERLSAQRNEKQPINHSDVEVTNSTDKNQQVANANLQNERPLLSESHVGLGKQTEITQKITKPSNTDESLQLTTKKTDPKTDTFVSIHKTDVKNEELLRTVEKMNTKNLDQTPKNIISRLEEYNVQDSNPLSLGGEELTETADHVTHSSNELTLNFSNEGSTGEETPATRMPTERNSIEQPFKSDHPLDEVDSKEAKSVPTQDSLPQWAEDQDADPYFSEISEKLHNTTTEAPDNESRILIEGSDLSTVANEMLNHTERTRTEFSDRVSTGIPMDLNNLGQREFSPFQYISTEMVDMADSYDVPPPIIDSLSQGNGNVENSVDLATSTESKIVSAEDVKVLELSCTTGDTFCSTDESKPRVTVQLPGRKMGAENETGHSSEQTDSERTTLSEKAATNKSNTSDSQKAIGRVEDNASPLPSLGLKFKLTSDDDLGKKAEKIEVYCNEDCQTRGQVEALEHDKSNKAEWSTESPGDNEKVTSVTHLRPTSKSIAVYNEPPLKSYLVLDPDSPLPSGVEDSRLPHSSMATASLANLTEMSHASDRTEDLYDIESHAVISHPPTEKQDESGMHAISVGLVSDSVLTLTHPDTFSTSDSSVVLSTLHNTDSVIQTNLSGPQCTGSTSSLGQHSIQPETSASLDCPEQPGSGHSTVFTTKPSPTVSSELEKAANDLQNVESSSHHDVYATDRVNFSDSVLPNSDGKSELILRAQHNQTGSDELNATTSDSVYQTSETASSRETGEVAGSNVMESGSPKDPNSSSQSSSEEFTSFIDTEANTTVPVQLTFPPPALDDISSGGSWSDNNSLGLLPPTQSEHLARSGSADDSDTAYFPMSSPEDNRVTQNDGFVPHPRSGNFHLPGSKEKDSAPPSSLTFTAWFFAAMINCWCRLS